MIGEITWDPTHDKHCIGHCVLGKLYIRLNTDNKVTGLYTMWDNSFKWVPETKEEETLEGTKIVASIMLEDKLKMINFLENGHIRDTV